MSLLAQPTPVTEVLREILPTNTPVEVFVLTPDGQHAYYLDSMGGIWLHDRARKRTASIATGNLWDLVISPRATALAYVRGGATPNERHVWITPLDPVTGLASGPARQLSASHGDVPSISPDGRWVAFARNDSSGVGQSIVVVPLGGGSERVLAPALPSSVDNIRWTPDGKTLYFGVNPPVPCVPDSSCLTLTGVEKDPAGSIRRVSIDGGPTRIVAATRSSSPGLSPDGTILVYIDTGVAQPVVTDTNGARMGVLDVPATLTVTGWLRNAILLLRESGNLRRFRSGLLHAPDFTPHTLFEARERVTNAAWSPDSKMFSVVWRAANGIELRIFSASGAPYRALPLRNSDVSASSWSPDQRWIAYTGARVNQSPRLQVIEIGSGSVTELFDLEQSSSAVALWGPDSRGLIVSDIPRGTGANRRVVFRKIDLSGQTKILRDVQLGDAPSVGMAINTATALLVRGATHDVRLIPLQGDSSERTIVSDYFTAPSSPSFSPDRQWMVLRRSGNDTSAVLEVMRIDGTARTLIKLPFALAPGSSGQPVLSRGGRELIVVERGRRGDDPGVYLVEIATSIVRRLFTYSSRGARSGPPEILLSPDGRTVLSAVWEIPTPPIHVMDLSSFFTAR